MTQRLALHLNRTRILSLLAAACAALAAPAALAQTPNATDTPLTLNYTVPPRANFTRASFRFWTPLYDRPIRGIIVIVPGLNRNGLSKLNDPSWQDLARKYRLALVSCFFEGDNYANAADGSGGALREALADFARNASHPEVSTAPLLLYGESAGGQFNYDFAIWKPERLMAFIVNKGGLYNPESPNPEAYSVPGLFFLGMSRPRSLPRIWPSGKN